MSDWATKKAEVMLAYFNNDAVSIAQALRQARLDTLDEAAGTIMLKWGNQEIADFLHTLKEKQP